MITTLLAMVFCNIVITMIFDCQIVDFGLPKVREISEQIQRHQACAGTVSFTAPEVFNMKVEKGKEKKVDDHRKWLLKSCAQEKMLSCCYL